MKKTLALLVSLLTLSALNCMEKEDPLPWQSYEITENLAPRDKEIVGNFVITCEWVPGATVIDWVGPRVENGGYYSPWQLYTLLSRILPKMEAQIRQFAREGNSTAASSLGLFRSRLVRSFRKLRAVLKIGTSEECQLTQDQLQDGYKALLDSMLEGTENLTWEALNRIMMEKMFELAIGHIDGEQNLSELTLCRHFLNHYKDYRPYADDLYLFARQHRLGQITKDQAKTKVYELQSQLTEFLRK